MINRRPSFDGGNLQALKISSKTRDIAFDVSLSIAYSKQNAIPVKRFDKAQKTAMVFAWRTRMFLGVVKREIFRRFFPGRSTV